MPIAAPSVFDVNTTKLPTAFPPKKESPRWIQAVVLAKNEVANTVYDGIANIAKLFKEALSFLAAIPDAFAIAKHQIAPFGFFADTLKFLGSIKNLNSFYELLNKGIHKKEFDLSELTEEERKIVQPVIDAAKTDESQLLKLREHKKALEVSSKFFGATTAVMAGFKVLDMVGALKLSSITAALGRIPVIGQAAPFLPFGSVYAAFSAVKSGLDIATSTLKIIELNKKMKRAVEKEKTWGAPLTPAFIEGRVKHLETKKLLLQCEGKALNNQFVKAAEKTTNLVKKWETAKTKKGLRGRIAQHSAKCSVRTSLKAEKKIEKQLKDLKASHTKLGEKIQKWQKVDHTKLDTIQKEKQVKWKNKISNIRLDKVKEGVGIAINSVSVIALLSVIILTAVGAIAAMPWTLIVGGLFLSLAVGGLGLYIFKKYPNKKIESVKIPQTA